MNAPFEQAPHLGVPTCPYTIALMGMSLVLGALHVLAPPHLTQEIPYAIFLPGLIFEAAIHHARFEQDRPFPHMVQSSMLAPSNSSRVVAAA